MVVSEMGLELVERDKKIFREIDRWRIVQGRHIRELAGFSGQRACDKRLRKLIEAGYIKRERILYGIAGIYTMVRAVPEIGLLKKQHRKIKVEQITHDIAVLDTAIYFNKMHGVEFSNITTELELHRMDGFGQRKHQPDFIFTQNEKTTCIEVELSLKSKSRFLKNILDNFMTYDVQVWVVPSMRTKIAKTLQENRHKYTNIEILTLEEIETWKT